MSTQSLYEKSLRSFLLTKYTSAATSCLKAIASLKQEAVDDRLQLNIWTLYLNIASTLIIGNSPSTINTKLLGIQTEKSIESMTRRIWSKIVEDGFQGNPGIIDARIISSCLVMNLKLNEVKVARDIAEDWFAALPDTTLDHIYRNQENDQVGIGYKEVVQIYTTRILTALNDYESANTFLEYNSILNDHQKKSLENAIEEQRESIEKKKKLEEERRLAAENKERELQEKLKLEEEKKRMEEEQNRQKEELARRLKEEEKEQHEIKEQPSLINEPIVPRSMKQERREETSVQKWKSQLSSKGVATSGAILIFIFALFALLRGQRGRLSLALQSMMKKLWETVKMGTKVTYI